MRPLAINVVYLVTPDNAGLLDLHLDRIARHTRLPYTLYASANRLDPELARKLAARPNITLCDIPTTQARDSKEHAYYLDHLVERAAADGAEYLATLHVDSFPVRDGWDEQLLARLTSECPVAAVTRLENFDQKPNPCGLLFSRAFYQTCRPTFRLSPEVMASPKYRAYREALPHLPDSGVGYGYALHQHGLTWHRLERSNRGEDHALLGSLYGDMLFHLGAAARNRKVFYRDWLLAGKKPLALRTPLLRWLWFRLPPRLRRALDPNGLPPRIALENQAAFAQVRDRLLADPESYLEFLRTGLSRSSRGR
jgi:hypothetical protein